MVVLVALGVLALTTRERFTRVLNDATGKPEPTRFVGSAACASCHTQQSEKWKASQHHAAMAVASGESVLGNFDNVSFTYAGITSVFSARGGKFFVRTDGRDGRLADFEVKYTFGVYPLQQYLIEFPDGRLQALSIAWDARSQKEGGQRWFHLYPSEAITYRDELHWTRPAQNWNYMCADCHSTAVRKNYDSATNRFDTRFSEISVGCEACHGPGSRHVAWGKKHDPGTPSSDPTRGLTAQLDERHGVTWSINVTTGNAARSRPRTSEIEIGVCAQCHARRSQLSDGYEAGKQFLDYYRPALLTRPLYYVDGQQRDEVYTWGSFLQSRMYAHGVTCSDCHEPHSGKLRAAGNAMCSSCHQSAKYDQPAHHHHTQASTGANCVSCHMPAAKYMVIDPRHDHSIRVPRPDLTVTTGAPNACNSCHTNRDARWAATTVTEWYPARRQSDRWALAADAIAAADRDTLETQARVHAVISNPDEPAITRATAFSNLSVADGAPAALRALVDGLHDGNDLIRLGALQAVAKLPPEWRAQLAAPLLSDASRALRAETARTLAGGARNQFNAEQSVAYERATADLIAVLQFSADRADARVNLGTFYGESGNPLQAETELTAALRLDPDYIPAYVNLADVYRTLQRDVDGERVLREGIARAPRNAFLHYALGLALVRQQRSADALTEFARAVELDPAQARFAYVNAVALHSAGKADAAIAKLEQAIKTHPNNSEMLSALASFYKGKGDAAKARHYYEQVRLLAARQRVP